MFRNLLLAFAALLVFAFAGLLLVRTLPYYSFEPDIGFLATKSSEINRNPWFRAGFYVHISTSLIVLVLGLLQWLPGLARWGGPRLHRWLGLGYAIGILALAAPSGLVLAWVANGGLVARVAFALQCAVWWVSTWAAYRAARRRNWPRHATWQVRSYAVTLAALSLRAEVYVLHRAFHTRPIETYLTAAWLAWVGNLLLAEVLLEMGLGRYFLRELLPRLRRTFAA